MTTADTPHHHHHYRDKQIANKATWWDFGGLKGGDLTREERGLWEGDQEWNRRERTNRCKRRGETGEEEDENDGVPRVQKWGEGCCLLPPSIYNPVVKSISNTQCMCVWEKECVCLQHHTQTNSMLSCCHDNLRPRIWTQTMPPETNGAMATGSSPVSFFLHFINLISRGDMSPNSCTFDWNTN